MTYTRYAIYYTPAPGPLADFGARWLGWDIETGAPRDHPDMPALPTPVSEITETPRKYGFHATIKPPFHLAAGCSEADLLAAARQACATRPPVTLDGLRLTRIGGFLALVPIGDTTALADLAAAMVRDLDPFRADPSEAELARRRRRRLTDRQDAMLRQWGYPYVMEEFRFHMTLSGSLPGDMAEAVARHLAPLVDSVTAGPLAISDLSLVGELPTGRLKLVQRFPLNG